VLPAATAYQLTNRYGMMLLLSWVAGVVASGVGLVVSYYLEIPSARYRHRGDGVVWFGYACLAQTEAMQGVRGGPVSTRGQKAETRMQKAELRILLGLALGLRWPVLAGPSCDDASGPGRLGRNVGGGRVAVTSLLNGNEDPHTTSRRRMTRVPSPVPTFWSESGSALRTGSTAWCPMPATRGGDYRCIQGRGHTQGRREPRPAGETQGHPFGNPHIWLDPQNAKAAAFRIAGALSAVDSPIASLYQANALRFGQRLDSLTDTLTQLVKTLPDPRFVSYHETWPYFCHRFGFEVVAAIEPCPDRSRRPGISPDWSSWSVPRRSGSSSPSRNCRRTSPKPSRARPGPRSWSSAAHRLAAGYFNLSGADLAQRSNPGSGAGAVGAPRHWSPLEGFFHIVTDIPAIAFTVEVAGNATVEPANLTAAAMLQV